MIRRDAVEELAPRLSSQGFKLLLDIMTTARGTLRPAELPYTFRQRQHGESKLDAHIILDFAALLVAKLTNDAVSFRFLMFCFVGLTGVVIHMARCGWRSRAPRCVSRSPRSSRPWWRCAGTSSSTTC